LVHHGFLHEDMGNYSILKLTEAARPLWRGDQQVIWPRPQVKPQAARRKSRRDLENLAYDTDLFEALKACRKQLAEEAGVPPFVIFGDQALMEMAALRPADAQSLLEVHGVGHHKLKRYGPDFLAVIRSFSAEQPS